MLACEECSPIANKSLLGLTNSSLFNLNASTAALPIAVNPSIFVKSSLQRKCFSHLSFLGLKSLTILPVLGSRARVRADLKPLHQAHANSRLSRGDVPSLLLWMMCSQCIGALVSRAGKRQYSQRLLARSKTNYFNLFGTVLDDINPLPDSQLAHQFLHLHATTP